MRNTIIAVGGSGQSAAIAYLRMATLSGMPANEIPDILVIDADINASIQTDRTKPSLYGSLEVLHEHLTAGLPRDTKPKLELIYPYYTAERNSPLLSNETFASHILGRPVQNADANTKYLLDALFSNQIKVGQETSEQMLPLSKGFMARPNVGATTFFDKRHRQPLDRALEQLQQQVGAATTNPIVVVIGSSFGGTGSGVAPSIAQTLANEARQNNRNVRLGLFVTLPWFSPTGTKTKTNVENTYGNDSTQQANSAGGLRYYAKSKALQLVDLFIADYDGILHQRNDDSNSEQPEYEYIFNLMLAAQIQNYFIYPRPRNTPGCYTFYHVKPDGTNHIKFDASDCPLLGFSLSNNIRQDLQAWANETQSLRLALKHTANFLDNHFRYGDGGKRESKDFPALIQLGMVIAEQDGRHSAFDTIGTFKKEKIPANRIFQDIANKLRERERQLKDSITWLSKLEENTNLQEKNLILEPTAITNDPDTCYKVYPALEDSRSEQVAAVSLFAKAMKQEKAVVDNAFNKRIEAGQNAIEALSAEVEKYIRATIREQGGVQQHRNNDSEGSTGIPPKHSIKLLLPLQADGNIEKINRYLIPISLEQLVNSTTDRNGANVSILESNHPATINTLQSSNIPSPWGAALLESWQQEAAHFFHAEKPELLTPILDRIEAVLWGIFSKRLIVTSIGSNSILAKTAIYARNLELAQNSAESSIFVAIHAQTKKLIAANYPSIAWFNVPNVDQWWLIEQDFELPLRILEQANNPNAYVLKQIKAFNLWINNILTFQTANGRQPIWYKTLTELANKLQNGLITFEEQYNNNIVIQPAKTLPQTFFLLNTQDATGLQQLQQIPCSVLSQSFDDIVRDYCVDEVLLLQDKHKGSLQIPDSPLRSKYLNSLSACLLEKPEYNAPLLENEEYRDITYIVTIPDCGEMQVVCKGKIITEFSSSAGIWPKFKAPRWSFYYFSSFESQRIKDDGYRLGIWGKDGWLGQIKNQFGEIENKPLEFGKNYELYGVPTYLILFNKTKEDNYLEAGAIRINLTDRQQQVGGIEFCLGLDFGTSHSCVYVALPDERKNIEKEIILDFSTEAYDLLYKAISSESGDKALYAAFNFLGGLVAAPMRNDKNVIPSELKLHGNDQHKQVADKDNNIEKGIHHFAGLPMAVEGQFLSALIKNEATLSDFKWGIGKIPGTSFNVAELSKLFKKDLLRQTFALLRWRGYDDLKCFRATFPESFDTPKIDIYAGQLANVLANLQKETGFECRSEKSNNRPPIEITNENDFKRHLLDFNSHVQGISRQDYVTHHSHGLISESQAALQTAASLNAALESNLYGISIALDMGGGSTDVAVYISKAYFESHGIDNVQLPRLTDSLLYAGHDALKILATPDITGVLNGNDKLEHPEDRLRVLKVSMRNQNDVTKLKTYFSENSSNGSEARRNVRLFFEGIFEYTRQLILTYDAELKRKNYSIPDWNVHILLLGNAWHLGDLVYDAQQTDSGRAVVKAMEAYFKRGSENNSPLLPVTITPTIEFPIDKDFSVKQAIARGALLFSPISNPFQTSAINHMGFAGFTLKQGEKLIEQNTFIPALKKRSEKITVGEINLPDTFTEEISKFDKNRSSTLGNNSNHSTKGAINKRISEVQSEHDYRGQDTIDVVISPMRYFLEERWKTILMNKSS